VIERRFTREEASELLPWLREVLPRIRTARQVVLEGGEHLRRWTRLDGGGRQGKEYWEALDSLRRDVVAVAERGVILRDPETGLVDFPASHEGKEILLCWRLGEGEIGFWHDPGSGFAGRRPLH
jgi:hypothetical protein